MKIGITGASGFLGSALIAEAVDRDWSVVAFSRKPERQIPLVDEVRSLADLDSIDTSGLDALIHLSGEPIVGWWTKEKKRRILQSRIDLTSALVHSIGQISRTNRPGVFISASAVGFYGDRDDDWLDEEADGGFGFLPKVCREWEAASAGVTKLGVRLVNPRIGIVLGRHGFLKRLRPVFRMGLGGKIGSGNQWMSWIHAGDLARLFLECVSNEGIRGRVNAVSPNPVRNREFTSIFARVLGRFAVIPVPSFLLKKLPGGMSHLFLDSQRVDPVVMKAFQFDWEFPDLESALRDTEGKEAVGERSEKVEPVAEEKE